MASPAGPGAPDELQNSEPLHALESLPAPETFSKPTFHEQVSQSLSGKRIDEARRDLKHSEVAVMGLNEISASRGNGYFQHIRTKKPGRPPGEAVAPASRSQSPLGASIPNVVFTRYTWGALKRPTPTRRWQFIMSDFASNPPASMVPLYPIQFIVSATDPIFTGVSESLVIIQGVNTYYALKSSELESLVGRYRKKRKLAGPESELRLASINDIWKTQKLSRREEPDGVQSEQKVPAGGLVAKLAEFQCATLQDVYSYIVEQCVALNFPTDLTAGKLLDLLPRAESPEVGVPLGTLLLDSKGNEIHYSSRNEGLTAENKHGVQRSALSKLTFVPRLIPDHPEAT